MRLDIYIVFALFLRYFEPQFVNLVENYFFQFSSVANQLFTLVHPICHTFKMERLFAFRCTQIFKIFFEYFLFFFDINSFIHLQHKQKLRISIYELGIATEVLSIIQWFYLVLCQLNFWSCTNRLDKGQNFGELQCLKTMWLVEVTEQVWVIYLKKFIL